MDQFIDNSIAKLISGKTKNAHTLYMSLITTKYGWEALREMKAKHSKSYEDFELSAKIYKKNVPLWTSFLDNHERLTGVDLSHILENIYDDEIYHTLGDSGYILSRWFDKDWVATWLYDEELLIALCGYPTANDFIPESPNG